jgi:hypothetical protein
LRVTSVPPSGATTFQSFGSSIEGFGVSFPQANDLLACWVLDF